MCRTRKRLRLSKSPLVLVLAQVRFTPILSMEGYVPKIQESLRARYPYYSQTETKGIIFGPEPSLQSEKRWKFLNKKKSSSVSLSNTFVTLATNLYTKFEDFIEELDELLKLLGECVEITLTERLGLRYVDLVRLTQNESFNDYFESNLHGIQGKEIGAETFISKFEFVGVTDFGKLVIRCTESMNGSFLPADLSDMADSALDYKITLEPKEKVRFLDFDHYSESPLDFSVPEIIETFWQLHDNCDLAFRQSVTDYAKEKWGAMEDGS